MSSRDQLRELSGVQGAADDEERRLFHGELLRFEAMRGYRPAWTQRMFCARFGVSPPNDWQHDTPAPLIRPTTYGWIRGRLLEYAQQCASAPPRKRRSHTKQETLR